MNMHIRLRSLFMLALFAFWAVSLRAEDLFFDSDGVKIHYVVQGEGEPVLLIHGFSANIATQWAMPGVLGALSQEYKVIALDNRGHGKSDKPREVEKYGMCMVEDAVRLLDHLKIKKAHVVGYSMGGFITMKLIATHPDRLLSASPCGAGWSKIGDDRLSFIDELADSLDSGNGFGPLLKRLTPEGQPPPTEERIKNMNAMMSQINDVKALAACIRGMKQLTVTEEELKANKVPTQAIIGAIDPLKQSLDPMVGVMSNLNVIVIPEADHMTAFGKLEFRDGLRGFIEQHRIPAKP